jgi:protein TonB
VPFATALRFDLHRGFSPGTRGVAALLAALVTAALLAIFTTAMVRTMREPSGRPRLTVYFLSPAEAPPPTPLPLPTPEPARPDPVTVADDHRVAAPERMDAGIRLSEAAAPTPVAGTPDGGADRGPAGAGDARTGGIAATAAPAAGGGTDEILPAEWAIVPSRHDLKPHDPYAAKVARVSGYVVLTCHVLASQQLRDCTVAREKPTGFGFGQGALAAARNFRVKPPQRNGVVLEQARVAIPISFINP